MSFNPDNALFMMEYVMNPNSKLPTEIYLNEDLFYPNGFNVILFPPELAQWKKISKNHLEVQHLTQEKSILFVSIAPL